MTNVCETCGLPDKLCLCEDIEKEQQEIYVKTEERSYGKKVTIAMDFDEENIDIGQLASELKSKLACGGTVNENSIELQGNHKSKLSDILEDKGYKIQKRS